jgi:hypothetical protein
LQRMMVRCVARNLVDALDTTRRLAFALGNLSTAERGPEGDEWPSMTRHVSTSRA